MAPFLPPSFLETPMLPQPATAPQPAAADFIPIGVGIDTSRYGHYAAFLRHDLQQAADELQFVESAAGYAQFHARLQHIVARHGSAVRFNPAVRALYARVVAKHPQRKAIAVGHAMRKLLHLAFAIWKSHKPFDKSHYPWDTPAHVELPDAPKTEQAAGLKLTAEPARKEVTATCPETLPANEPPDESTFIDFAHVKKQLSMTRVFEHLGLAARLKGPGPQKRCACPIHRADGRDRTFSVNLDQNVFHCFDAGCQKKGDVIDLWAALHQLELRQAALDLVRTFALEPAPTTRTEKRHG
jgi:hypothetical protein